MKDDNNKSRREFIRKSALTGTGIFMAGTGSLYAGNEALETANLKTRGYASFDDSGTLKPWTFERRPVGDNDVLIDVKYASICHSDIHQMKGHWGAQQYPQVP